MAHFFYFHIFVTKFGKIWDFKWQFSTMPDKYQALYEMKSQTCCSHCCIITIAFLTMVQGTGHLKTFPTPLLSGASASLSFSVSFHFFLRLPLWLCSNYLLVNAPTATVITNKIQARDQEVEIEESNRGKPRIRIRLPTKA